MESCLCHLFPLRGGSWGTSEGPESKLSSEDKVWPTKSSAQELWGVAAFYFRRQKVWNVSLYLFFSCVKQTWNIKSWSFFRLQIFRPLEFHTWEEKYQGRFFVSFFFFTDFTHENNSFWPTDEKILIRRKKKKKFLFNFFPKKHFPAQNVSSTSVSQVNFFFILEKTKKELFLRDEKKVKKNVSPDFFKYSDFFSRVNWTN